MKIGVDSARSGEDCHDERDVRIPERGFHTGSKVSERERVRGGDGIMHLRVYICARAREHVFESHILRMRVRVRVAARVRRIRRYEKGRGTKRGEGGAAVVHGVEVVARS